jgi:hypothetical protein
MKKLNKRLDNAWKIKPNPFVAFKKRAINLLEYSNNSSNLETRASELGNIIINLILYYN